MNTLVQCPQAFGEATWMSTAEVAQLFNVSVGEFTTEKFKEVYLDTWIKDHEREAAGNNPKPDAELEIIEQVTNETNCALQQQQLGLCIVMLSIKPSNCTLG